MKTKLLHRVGPWPGGTRVTVVGREPGEHHLDQYIDYWRCRMPDSSERAIRAGALDAHPHFEETTA